MRKSVFTILLIAGLVAVAQFCTTRSFPKGDQLSTNPIATVGHGSFLDREGKQIKLTKPFILQVQDLYVRQLSIAQLPVREGSRFDEQKIREIRKAVYSTVQDTVLANALFIEWLIEQRKPVEEAQYSTINNALRWYYVLKIQKDPVLPDKNKRWLKGLREEEARKLESVGIVALAITNAGMQVYCQECVEAGVPVPPTMFGSEWKRLGSFDGEEFISGELNPELMIYVSNDPQGFCLALPRYIITGGMPGNEAELFGVICLGTRTSKACFFDNPKGTFFRRDEVIDFRSNFVGGANLVSNGQGTCSDCHAGENPFVIHPEKAPFKRIVDDNLDGDRSDGHVPSTMPTRWYDPIVDGTWPQNPGPTNVLDAVMSSGDCSGCHRAGGSGGRLPDLSFPLRGYCISVLSNAVRPRASGGTMPPSYIPQDRSQFLPHINALTSYCSLGTADGKIEQTTIPPDPGFISPPIVVGPLYACAKRVAVRGAVLNAKVTLSVSGSGGTRTFVINPARNPLQVDVDVSPELRPGDVVTAVQEADGATSAPSESVTVRSYLEDYPAGPPKPAIDPEVVYACADLIAVRHLPGAIVTVFTNGRDPRSFTSSAGWTAIPPSGAPFREADVFTVQVSMCGDNSPLSDPIRARRAPTALSTPFFNPPNIFSGQELLNIENIEYGAKVTLRETAGSGWSGSFSTPITWFPNYDIRTALGRPLRTGDNLQAMQALCAMNDNWTPVEKMQDCERLPAPQIERPLAGNRFVVVVSAVPGARIMIYDSGGREIGDGSGTVIRLSRAIVAGETLSAVQMVGQCTSRFVYRVRASQGK